MEDITNKATKIVFLYFPCRVVVCESGETYGSTDPETNDLREYARIVPITKECGGVWITQYEFAGTIEWSKHAQMLSPEQRAAIARNSAKRMRTHCHTTQEASKTLSTLWAMTAQHIQAVV